MTFAAELLLPELQSLLSENRLVDVREALHGVHPADVADVVAGLEPSLAAVCFRVLQRDDAAAAFSYLEPHDQERLIAQLSTDEAAKLVDAMPPDDRARLVDELPEGVAQRLIATLSPESRRTLQAVLGYPPRTVGRLATPDFVAIRPGWTVAQSLDHIRRNGRDAETINVIYVVDEQGRLIDDLRLRALLLAEPAAKVEDLMNRSFVKLRGDQPQEEAVAMMARYDRTALPVVDSRDALIGIVTSADVTDVAIQRTTEQIQKLGGMEALDAPYMDTSTPQLIKKRGKWLAVLFLGEMLTASAMTHYNHELEKAVVLGLFLPLIISSGGNSGGQATTLIIRALALQEIGVRDWLKVFKRELTCGIALGVFLAIIGFVRIVLWKHLGWGEAYGSHYIYVALTVSVALIGVVLWGSLMGSMLPFLLRVLKLDPAAISAPLVATAVDVTGLIIYFSVASVILHGTLL